MKDFFKMMLASMTGCLLSIVLLFVIILILFSVIVSSMKTEQVEVKANSVILIDLKNAITERTSENPFENMNFSSMSLDKAIGLNNILRTIKYAASDEKISGILLDISDVNAGYATVDAIRNQIDSFKNSGKFVYAYGDNLSQRAYYLATVADKIYLNPEGSIEFKGIYMQTMFFKKALEKLDVDMQIIRHGKFKSAVEPFMLEKMSAENKLQMQMLANGIWEKIKNEVAISRKLDTANVTQIADSLFAFQAEGALAHGLVDSLIYRDELEALILSKSVLTGKTPYLSMNAYFSTIKTKLFSANKNSIAVIYAFGEIVNGKEKYGVISGKHIAKTIRDAAADPNIKAIVLRVNSPGGDALASDMIWREVKLANAKKPVVVSMGDYAASGGYYISCAARKIYAEATTITGSIGVFGVIPNMEKLFNNKLGISFDEVKTNKNSDFISTSKPLSDYNRATVQFMIEDVYSTFIKHVAEGRKMSEEQVDSIGQGRVWCGSDALRIGLVDELGGIDKAIDFAAKEAGITEFSIREMPYKKDFFATLLEDFEVETKISKEELINAELGEFTQMYNSWKQATNVSGVQMRLPYFLIIK